MKIVIETIPHQDHRYTTVGDWFYDPDGTLRIKVSELTDWRREALIAVHELVEVLLCQDKGIGAKEVDEFDMNFKGDSEPGDCPEAPYVRQHCIATGIERMLAAELNVAWEPYERELEDLPEVVKK